MITISSTQALDWSTLVQRLREHLPQILAVYARHEAFRIDFEARTRDEYFDFKQIADAQRDSFAHLRAREPHGSSGKDREPLSVTASLREASWRSGSGGGSAVCIRSGENGSRQVLLSGCDWDLH